MMRIPRFRGTTWLAATVALLLPALAWLQYDWANQLAAASRERRERTLRAASAQFTGAVNTEVSRLGGSLQLDGAMVERRDWDAYALRYDSVIESGAGALVAGVWFVDIDDTATTPEARLRLHEWRPEERSFEAAAWPASLSAVRTQLLAEPKRRALAVHSNPRDIFASAGALGDERTLVMPIVRVQTARGTDARPDRFTTDVAMRGFTIVGLNVEVMARERLPALAAEHFPESSEYRVAVVTTRDGRVLFESAPGAAADTADDPDLTMPLMQPRIGPMMFVTRLDADGRDPAGRAATATATATAAVAVAGGPRRRGDGSRRERRRGARARRPAQRAHALDLARARALDTPREARSGFPRGRRGGLAAPQSRPERRRAGAARCRRRPHRRVGPPRPGPGPPPDGVRGRRVT